MPRNTWASKAIPAPPPPAPRPKRTWDGDAIPAPPAGPEQRMAEAVAWVAKLRAKKLPEAPQGGFVFISKDNRLRTSPRRLRKEFWEFFVSHREELIAIAKATVVVPAMPKPAGRKAKRKERTSAPATRPPRVSSIEEPKPRVSKVASPIDTTDSPRPRPVVPKEPEPEFYVEGYRITEHDVRSMLSWFSDEELAAYDEGRVSKDIAYANCADAFRESVRIGMHKVFRGESGRVHMFPERHLLSEHVAFLKRLDNIRDQDFRSRR